jgi:hypothetical protein
MAAGIYFLQEWLLIAIARDAGSDRSISRRKVISVPLAALFARLFRFIRFGVEIKKDEPKWFSWGTPRQGWGEASWRPKHTHGHPPHQ